MAAQDDIESMVQPGQVLAGKYRIERLLGRGGMGVVVAAHHLQLDEKVAIKFLLPSAVGKPELLARFEREARAAVKIKSEHVARVIDVAVLDSGSPYMVMEFLQGQDLSAYLAAHGRLSVMQTADFVLQACEAIVEAHALGIVHRDLKPANLFVTRGADGLESIKVLDFGISKASALSGSAGGPSDMTQTQSMLGSPFYMSPEQMQSARSVDSRTDIWALGCILYQCVAGEVPFEAETLPELVLKIVQSPPRLLRELRQDVPPGFEQVVTHCLQKHRDQRYSHIGDLALGLVPYAPDRGRSSADRIMRVVQTSGLAAGAPSRLPSSSSMEAAKQATVNMAQSPVSDPSPTGPGLPASPYAPGGGTVGMGPPPNTLPPGKSSGSGTGFGVTSSSGTWGNSSVAGVPKTSPLVMVAALLGGLLVIGALGSAAFFATRHLRGGGDAHPDASAILVGGPSATTSAPPLGSTALVTEPEDAAAPGEFTSSPAEDAGAPHPVLSLSPIPQPAPLPAPLPVKPPAPAPVPVPVPVPGPGPSAKPNCTPPYYYDEKKNRVFKKECL